MAINKWIMKQYWRVGTIRALASLALGMLVLGRYYYIYIPVLSDLGWIGAIILGTVLIFLFIGIGWLYDQKTRMWSQKLQANIERNPYSYVPNLKEMTFEYPIFYTLIQSIKKLAIKIRLDIGGLDELEQYMKEFFDSRPNIQDIREAERRALIFMMKYPFDQSEIKERPRGSISHRVKLSFETQMLRLTWIQSLTGLVQDVFIFGALYVVVLFPTAHDMLKLFLSVFLISIPLLVILTIFGWYYDRKMKIWSVDMAVKVERDPYSYVPEPYLFSRIFPFFFAFLSTLREVFRVKGISLTEIDSTLEYLANYAELSVSKTQDFRTAQEFRTSLGMLFQKTDDRSKQNGN